MNGPDPIDGYLRELERQLRVRRGARRRIVAEIHAHLHDAVAAERLKTGEAGSPAERALARFGRVPEAALAFNCLADRRRMLFRRALAPWVVAAALMSLATATVWALGANPPRPRQPPGESAPKRSAVLPRTSGQPPSSGGPTLSQPRAPIPRSKSTKIAARPSDSYQVAHGRRSRPAPRGKYRHRHG